MLNSNLVWESSSSFDLKTFSTANLASRDGLNCCCECPPMLHWVGKAYQVSEDYCNLPMLLYPLASSLNKAFIDPIEAQIFSIYGIWNKKCSILTTCSCSSVALTCETCDWALVIMSMICCGSESSADCLTQSINIWINQLPSRVCLQET